MLLSTLEELRLYSPANAIDNISTLQGFLDSSEQDFLLEKLGQKLYDALCAYYRQLRDDDKVNDFINDIAEGNDLKPYARLLTLAQRIITFDALGRAVDMQAISVNGAGVNMATADDYGKADNDAVKNYKATCVKEAHAAVNRLLVVLEQWTQETSSYVESQSEDEQTDEQKLLAEKHEIAGYWRCSRFFYLAASLLIPSASVLQEYLNIYDSREKFIQMLPDLRYIQEDVIAPVIGEDMTDYLVSVSQQALSKEDSKQRLLIRIIHKARKAMARHLESRTMQFRITDQRRETARTEATRLTTDLAEYITVHYQDLPDDGLKAFKASSLYEKVDDDESNDYVPQFENNADGSVMFITPSI